VDKEFHTVKRDTIHVSNVGIRGKHAGSDIFDNNLVERLHGTIRERNKTPAEVANIDINLGKKKWENLLIQSVRNQKEKK